MIKGILVRMFQEANERNRRNILALAGHCPANRLLDLGCDNGDWTMRLAERAGAREIFGVEINRDAAAAARQKGIEVSNADLMQKLPFADGSFDLVHANQVIEHVPDIDHFASEAVRVLKPGGRLVISTENGSSWHNIFAAVMGWQIFSSTNFSSLRSGVGNPLALHRGSSEFAGSWTHKTIFNYLGLLEFMKLHGLVNLRVRGSGYYPLPAVFGDIDRRHAHFLAVAGERAKA